MAVTDFADRLTAIADRPLGQLTSDPAQVSPDARTAFTPSSALGRLTGGQALESARTELAGATAPRPAFDAGAAQANAEAMENERRTIDKQLQALADTLAFSGELEERGQQLGEFNKLTDLRLSNLDREVGLAREGARVSLDRYLTTGRIEQQDVRNALNLQRLQNDFKIKNLELDLAKDIEMKRIDIDKASLKIAREHYAQTERAIRMEDEFNRGVLGTKNEAMIASILQGGGQAAFGLANVLNSAFRPRSPEGEANG